jgi:uncharacterized membrane protein YcaP (DUF421 family)
MLLLSSILRTVLIYLVLIAGVRLMGKRQIGQLEPSEFVVTMLVANLASIPMENPEIPLLTGIVPIVTVLVLEILLSVLSLHSIPIRRFLCGKPVILIENGKILRENLRRSRITLDELTGHLREKDVLDPRSVQFAILETNGNLSVFPYPKDRPASAGEAGIRTRPQHMPITLISDGKIVTSNLSLAKKDQKWVQNVLSQRQATVEETLLLLVDKSDRIIFYRKE